MGPPFILKVYGPPGTGKTSYLLSRVQEALNSGQFQPEDIAFVAFTKAAANEAIARSRLIADAEFPWFRTIHSACFRLLGLHKGQVMDGKDWRAFGAQGGYDFSDEHHFIEELEIRESMLKTLGDSLRHFDQWRRNRMLGVDQGYKCFPRPRSVPWDLSLCRLFRSRLADYKAATSKVDFTDMIEMVLREELSPAPRMLVVDEGQDLSKLMWLVIDLWMQRTERVIYAGDEDQCLYQWLSAEPKVFLDRPCDEELVLGQSYRVPRAVHAFSQALIQRNKVRHPKIYRPTSDPGYLLRGCELTDLPIQEMAEVGTVFMLARNIRFLDSYTEVLKRLAIPYENLRGPSPFKGRAAKAYWVAHRLSKGHDVSIAELNEMIHIVSSKPWLHWGYKTELAGLAASSPGAKITLSMISGFTPATVDLFRHGRFEEALQLPKETVAYLSNVIKKWGPETLLKKPKTLVGSVHSVKGAEADNVILSPDMARASFRELLTDPEGERRVFYVGATRARRGLWLLNPSQPEHYTW